MVFSVSPSVIIKEIDNTATIPAVSNSPAAIAGVFNWGPVGERILVSSESDLLNRFGKPNDNNAETFFVAADFLAYSNSLYVVRVHDGAVAAHNSGAPLVAKYPGSIGNSISVSYVTSAIGFSSVIASVGDLSGDLNFNTNQIEISTATNIEDTIFVGDVLRIGSDTVGYQNLTVSTILEGSHNPITNVAIYTIKFTTKYALSADNLQDVSITRYWQYHGSFANPPATNSIHLVVVDRTGDISGDRGAVLERYENVSLTDSSRLQDGTANFWKDVVDSSSAWVTSSNDITAGENFKYHNFVGGSDGSPEYSISFGKLAQGYDLFKESDEVDVSFILQGKAIDNQNANLANYIIANIIDFRKDCVLFISPRKQDVVGVPNEQTKTTNVINFRKMVQNSSYWFMDTGYKYRYDKYNDVYRWTPLNGDIAGLEARISPWESPAGYKRGVIKNVVKLAFNPNKTQRDQLFGIDINPVIAQVGQGILLFGDKTGLGISSAFNRINVRRLFITIEKAIATASASFLFDFNDEFTQTQFKNMVEPYLRDIQGQRGIIDFRVVSDSTVNTPDIVDSNIFRGNIYIKPARTISIIELTFVATRSGVSFDEIVGQQL